MGPKRIERDALFSRSENKGRERLGVVLRPESCRAPTVYIDTVFILLCYSCMALLNIILIERGV
jgi:hypothetical protein